MDESQEMLYPYEATTDGEQEETLSQEVDTEEYEEQSTTYFYNNEIILGKNYIYFSSTGCLKNRVKVKSRATLGVTQITPHISSTIFQFLYCEFFLNI